MKHLSKRHKFINYIKERFFLRFHMSLILTATALSGLLATKVLLLLDVKEMLVRYPLAVVFSYLVFFALVKLWLWYISLSSSSREESIVGDVLDAVGNSIDVPDFPSGGGSSGGGGASASFDVDGSSIIDSSSEMVASAGKGVGNAVGDVGDIFDEGGIVLIVLGLLLAAIFGSSLYLVYSAPAILSEAAFEALMATSLIKAAKRIDENDWMGSVLRSTIGPFLIIFLLALLLAATVESYFPNASKLADVFK